MSESNNELYKEVPFDFVESFYYINDNYIICPNECFDLITYYFSSKFYEK